MNAKVVRVGEAARQPAMRGIDLVADLVAGTMGPAGRAVLVGRNHAPPLLLRNGYAIARNLELGSRDEQAGVLLMRDLAWRTSDAVGDGTSTAILAARAFVRAGRLAALSGIAPSELQAAIDAHSTAVLEALEAASCPAPEAAVLERVATQALGGDAALGALLAEAHLQAGSDGMVVIEEGRSAEDTLRFDAGLHFDQGWISPHLVDDARTRTIEIENPLILVHAGPITALQPVVRVLEMIAESGRGLVIIADSVAEDALTTLIANKRGAGLKVAAIKAPGAGAWRCSTLEDIAIATGAALIAEELGHSLAGLRPQFMGGAARVIVRRHDSTIIGGKGDPAAVATRTMEIRDAITREKHLSFDREQLRKRLARLQAGIATLGIGGRTPTHLQLRLEQARNASATLAAALPAGSCRAAARRWCMPSGAPRRPCRRVSWDRCSAACSPPRPPLPCVKWCAMRVRTPIWPWAGSPPIPARPSTSGAARSCRSTPSWIRRPWPLPRSGGLSPPRADSSAWRHPCMRPDMHPIAPRHWTRSMITRATVSTLIDPHRRRPVSPGGCLSGGHADRRLGIRDHRWRCVPARSQPRRTESI
ncbi:MAG: TCP-1/cpn60 chaperonin family protein [Geminicoccaceae bacterium]